jgi:hypothetical protein
MCEGVVQDQSQSESESERAPEGKKIDNPNKRNTARTTRRVYLLGMRGVREQGGTDSRARNLGEYGGTSLVQRTRKRPCSGPTSDYRPQIARSVCTVLCCADC